MSEHPERENTEADEKPALTNETEMQEALAPFGWTCGPDFWQRYYYDAWVFNLANAAASYAKTLAQRDRDLESLRCRIAELMDENRSLLYPELPPREIRDGEGGTRRADSA